MLLATRGYSGGTQESDRNASFGHQGKHGELMMRKQLGIAVITGLLASPVAARAQGIPCGAQQGAAQGNAQFGPPGAFVGGLFGGVAGAVGGLLGVPCSTPATVPCGEESKLAGGQQQPRRVRQVRRHVVGEPRGSP